MKAAIRWRSVSRGLSRLLFENRLEVLPGRRFVKSYTWWKARRDAGAGLSVALLAVAQGLAFAAMAGLPPSYGVTCAAVAAFFGPLFASSRHAIMGPTNATAFLIFSAMAAVPEGHRLEMMPLLALVVGLVLVAGAFFRLADMVQYVSRSVVVGYLIGSTVLIVANQLPHVLGLPASTSGAAKSFFGVAVSLFERLPQTDWQALVIAAAAWGLYALMKKIAPRWPGFAIVLAIMAAITALLNRFGWHIATLSPFAASDLLPVMPDLSKAQTWDHFRPLWSVALAVAFLSALESSIMARSLASRSGDRLEVNQELLGLGVANLACAAFSGMTASGSLTRSVLNYSSGAVSPLASLWSGILCGLAALFLGPALAWLPKAALAALVIAVAWRVVSRRQLRICLRATGSDAASLLVTFVATLLMPLHVAIFVGVATSVMLYLRKAAQPQLVEYDFNPQGELAAAQPENRTNQAISIVHVEGELFFGAAELFRTQIQRIAADPSLKVVILRLKNARHLDATSVLALEELISYMRSKNRYLLISGALKEVCRVLKNAGIFESLGRDNIFPGSIKNPNLATRNALKRAQKLLGTTDAEVRIFYDPNKKST